MIFNSLGFLAFLPLAWIIHWCIPARWRWMFLLIASYVFYMSLNAWYGLVLSGVTIFAWFSGRKISEGGSASRSKSWLLAGIIGLLACLVSFKYADLFYDPEIFFSKDSLNTHFSILHKVIMPVGLSFYVFRSLAYIIDIYRGNCKPEQNFARFALFISFFPEILAGPIERFSSFSLQLFERHKLTAEQVASAVRLMVLGFFKKLVIAGRLADYVDPLFSDPAQHSGSTLFLAGFLFLVQLYVDLSAYTDIARGVARLFGIELALNWKRPLLAGSLYEFWKRYHISVTSWFRDYVYVPLKGNRVSTVRWMLNIILVFVISGWWHGASLAFMLWGLINGLGYLLSMISKNKTTALPIRRFAGWILTLAFLSLSFIAFRVNSINDLGIIYIKIIQLDFHPAATINLLMQLNHSFSFLLTSVLILFLFMFELNEEFQIINKIRGFDKIIRPAFFIFLFVMIFVLGKFNTDEFIYFHF